MTEEIYLERDGAIATVTLNAPQRHNAFNLAMFRGLGRIAAELEADGDIRAVIFRGTGGKAFSAGADISEFEEHRSTREKAKGYAAISVPALHAVAHLKHPTIAAIEGLCVGGGLGLAACCDFRICGTSSRFGVPVKRLGLVEAIDELRPMVEKFGPGAAVEILVLGEVFPVADAQRLGMVNRVVADGEVDLVMSCMVLHHLSRPADTIGEAHRALKVGGRLIVVDLHRHGDESLREKLADLWLGFPPDEVRAWIQDNHFTIESAEVIGAPDTLQLITFQAIKKD